MDSCCARFLWNHSRGDCAFQHVIQHNATADPSEQPISPVCPHVQPYPAGCHQLGRSETLEVADNRECQRHVSSKPRSLIIVAMGSVRWNLPRKAWRIPAPSFLREWVYGLLVQKSHCLNALGRWQQAPVAFESADPDEELGPEAVAHLTMHKGYLMKQSATLGISRCLVW